MKTSVTGFIFLVLILASAACIWSETTTDPPELEELIGKAVRIETYGGGNFQGTLLAIIEDRLEIVLPDGQIIQVKKEAVEEYRELLVHKGRRTFYQDSASNRLIVIPTGFPMETGEFHITDQEIALITASYGLNQHVAFWGGISPLGALLNARFILTLGRSLAVSAGSFAGIEWVGVTDGPVSGLLLPYVLTSWGEPNNNITAGGAFAFTIDTAGGFQALGAVAVLGGKLVLTATTALVTENWFIWGKEDDTWQAAPLVGIFGLVFRIAGSRFSWDIGALLPIWISGGISGFVEGAYIPLPWISLTYRIM